MKKLTFDFGGKTYKLLYTSQKEYGVAEVVLNELRHQANFSALMVIAIAKDLADQGIKLPTLKKLAEVTGIQTFAEDGAVTPLADQI